MIGRVSEDEVKVDNEVVLTAQPQIKETDEQRKERLKAVVAALNFDRGAIRATDAELIQAIKNAQDTLTEILNNPALALYATQLAKQLGIYFGYHQRKPELAIAYFETYKKLALPGSLDQVHANMYLGYAGTIRPGYNDRSLFEEALRDLAVHEKSLEAFAQLTQELVKIRADQGYIECFLGLMIHRKSYQTPGISELDRLDLLDDAISHLKKGQKLQHAAMDIAEGYPELADLHTQLLIELPNTYHIESICHAKIPRRKEEIAALNQAIALENQYKAKIHKDHFLLYVSLQNHSSTMGLYLGKPAESLKVLQDVLQGQQELFKNKITGEYTDNNDIAKTHHFMGQILAKLERYQDAIVAFQLSFAMKLRLGSNLQAFDMLETQTLMLTAAAELRVSGVDNTLHTALMLKTVNTVLKLDWNDYKIFDGFKKLMKPLVPVVDFLMHYLPEHDPVLMRDLLQKLYELGAYHNHLKRSQPYNAIDYLNPALKYCEENPLAVDPTLHHWIIAHVAFTYHQELAQSYGKDLAYLRARYQRYTRYSPANITEENIRMYFYEKSMEAADKAIRFVLQDDLKEQSRIHSFGHLISCYNKYELQRYKTNRDEKINELMDVISECSEAVKAYYVHHDYQEQVLRANNRLADITAELVALLDLENEQHVALLDSLPVPSNIYDANKAKRKELKTEAGNPFAGRGYFSEANYYAKRRFIANDQDPRYLSADNFVNLQKAIDAYAMAHEILAISEGPKDGFTLDALKLKSALQATLTAMKQAKALTTTSTTTQAGIFSSSERNAAEAVAVLAAQQQSQQQGRLSPSPTGKASQ
jgi:hypothetical protein